MELTAAMERFREQESKTRALAAQAAVMDNVNNKDTEEPAVVVADGAAQSAVCAHGPENIVLPDSKDGIANSEEFDFNDKADELIPTDEQIRNGGDVAVEPTKKPVPPYDEGMVRERFAKRKRHYDEKCKQFMEAKPVQHQPSGFATAHVQKILKQEPTTDTSGANYYMNYMDYVKQFNFLLCAPPKTGTTNWKKAQITMIHQDFYKNLPDTNLTFQKLADELHWQTVYSITSKQLNEVRKKKQMYNAVFHNNATVKIMHVRHPLARLYSAWKDKFTRSGNFEHDFTVEKLFTMYDDGIKIYSDEERFPTPPWARVSFYAFLKMITEQTKWNSHWGNYWQICWPCLVDYDYITNTETIGEDSRYIFESLGLGNEVGRFPEKYDSSKTADYVKKVYSEIPAETMDKLNKLYKWDFELFGYSTEL